eukprot:7039432-Pyramimonas_sp.AAC.1
MIRRLWGGRWGEPTSDSINLTITIDHIQRDTTGHLSISASIPLSISLNGTPRDITGHHGTPRDTS